MSNFSRPIAAFSMADYENLNTVNFKRGKDKQKRKKRGMGFYAGVGGAGLAGAGALAGGIRYGGAELAARNASKRLDRAIAGERNVYKNIDDVINTKKTAESGGGIQKMRDDITGIKNSFSSNKDKLGKSFDRAKDAFSKGEGLGKIKDTFGSGKVGKAGLIGAGLLGAGALAGGGYAAYKAMKKRKKKD